MKENTVNYIYLESIPSTNTWVKERASSFDSDAISCVVAKEQTAGSGRFSRKWFSAKGNNIYATFYFCLKAGEPYIGNLSQILSLACCEVLEKKGFSPRIKWPNDVLIEEKKVAGILCETLSFPDRIGIVLGIGLNVDLPQSLLDAIDQPATSLKAFNGYSGTREELLEPLVEQFVEKLKQLRLKGFLPFLTAYSEHLVFKEGFIIHQEGTQTLKGTFDHIDEKGQLVMRLADGQRATLVSGEIKSSP